MLEGLVSVTDALRTVTMNARSAHRRDMTDMIDHIDQVRSEFGHLIEVIAQRDAELQAEEDQEEIDLAKVEEADLDITPFAEAWEGLLSVGPVMAPRARHGQYNSDQLEPLFEHGMLNAIMNLGGGVRTPSGLAGGPETTPKNW
jgi:hypothetical protein